MCHCWAARALLQLPPPSTAANELILIFDNGGRGGRLFSNGEWRVTTCLYSGSLFGGLFVIRFQFGPTSLQLLLLLRRARQFFCAHRPLYSPSSNIQAKVLINFTKRKAVKSF
jgi:hypothetical protein